ncbi:MAG: LDCC motif putative metal-binding protein [Tissierellia bacterium]|nr:LDCC motif putative metal-binding protein [Tissierellia bacterium]MDD4725506.1 LDCC motif putative metal-binding protein [Tissierellia bacterium]
MKNLIKRWLEKLEKANKDNFGQEPLDCCSLGREKNKAKPMKTTQNKK